MNKNEKDRMPREPMLPRVDELEKGTISELLPGQACENILLADPDLSETEASDAAFDSCVLKNVDLSASSVKGLRMLDVSFEHGNLANTNMDEAYLDRVRFVSVRMTGVKISGAKIKDVVFKNCKIDLSAFRFSKFKNVRFENCVLSEADFVSVEFENVVFAECDMLNADLSQTKLRNVDVSGSKIEGLKAGPEQLRGMTIDYSQVPYIVQLTGVTIK